MENAADHIAKQAIILRFTTMKKALIISMVVFLAGFAGCYAQDRNMDQAEAISAAEEWLALIEQNEYGKSWDKAAKVFRDAIPREHWIASMKSIREPLGKTLSREFQSASYHTTLLGAPDGKYLVIQYTSSFEKQEAVLETITPAMNEKGIWQVSGYYIK